MGVITSTVLGVAGMGAQLASMGRDRSETDLQQYVAELQGESQQELYKESSENLSEKNRETRASMRVAMAQSGSSGQQQPLMLLAKAKGRMVADSIELRRTGQIMRDRAQTRSLLIGAEGRSRELSGAASLIGQGYQLGSTIYNSRTSSTPNSLLTSSPNRSTLMPQHLR